MNRVISAVSIGFLCAAAAWQAPAQAGSAMAELEAAAASSREAAETSALGSAWSGAGTGFGEGGHTTLTSSNGLPPSPVLRTPSPRSAGRGEMMRRRPHRGLAAKAGHGKEKQEKHWFKRIAYVIAGAAMIGLGVAVIGNNPLGRAAGWGMMAAGIGLLGYSMVGDTDSGSALGAMAGGVATVAVGALGAFVPGWGALACAAMILSFGLAALNASMGPMD